MKPPFGDEQALVEPGIVLGARHERQAHPHRLFVEPRRAARLGSLVDGVGRAHQARVVEQHDRAVVGHELRADIGAADAVGPNPHPIAADIGRMRPDARPPEFGVAHLPILPRVQRRARRRLERADRARR